MRRRTAAFEKCVGVVRKDRRPLSQRVRGTASVASNGRFVPRLAKTGQLPTLGVQAKTTSTPPPSAIQPCATIRSRTERLAVYRWLGAPLIESL